MNIINEVEKQRKEIITDSYTSTWRELLSTYKDSELIIDPEYQRLFRWNIDSQTQFIESLLLGIPSPSIFLAENKNGTNEILDGLQRLSTLIRFFTTEIHEVESINNDDPCADENINDLLSPTILTEGPLIKSLQDYSAKTLPEALSRTIKNSRVTVILVKRESDINARIEVFKRLNRYGSLLSDQEIRNAMGMLHGKKFATQLRILASNSNIKQSIDLNEKLVKQMGIEELILRLMAFFTSSRKFKHSISNFLDQYMIEASSGKIKLDNDFYEAIEKSFDLIAKSFPENDAFKFPKRGFSTNLFDIIAAGVLENIDHLTVKILKQKHAALMKSHQLIEVTGAGSNTKSKLVGRVDLGKEWFS